MTDVNSQRTYANHLTQLLCRNSSTQPSADDASAAAALILLLLERESAGDTHLDLAEHEITDGMRKILSTHPMKIVRRPDGQERLLTARTAAALEGVDSWFERASLAAERIVLNFSHQSIQFSIPDSEGKSRLQLGADDQIPAILKAVCYPFSVITGGPGTGKTTIIAACLAELLLRNPDLGPEQIVLTAPTGKAAQRLKKGLNDFCAVHLNADQQELRNRMNAIPDATTLHGLLGANVTRTLPLKGEVSKLAQRVVIVDECSMVSAELMCTLMLALAPDTRLVLVGDADQLPSVECGAVFRDMVARLEEQRSPLVQRLIHSRRSVPEIIEQSRHALREGLNAAFEWSPLRKDEQLAALPVRFINGVEGYTPEASYSEWLQIVIASIFRQFAASPLWANTSSGVDTFKIIVARRDGIAGMHDINNRCQELAQVLWSDRRKGFLVGEPIMVTENIHLLGLSNGDVGIVEAKATPRKHVLNMEDTILQARFSRGNTALTYNLDDLNGRFERAWSSTCHKTQGSEFENVFIVLPEGDCPLITPQWLYTAMTRAKRRLTIIRSHRDTPSSAAGVEAQTTPGRRKTL